MQTQLATLCQSVAVDRFTNRLSLFNIIERIEAPQFPVILPEATFIIVLRREANEQNRFDATVSIALRTENQTMAVGEAHVRVDFENGLGTRQITNFQGLPLLSPGVLEFRTELLGQVVVTEIPVVVGPGAA